MCICVSSSDEDEERVLQVTLTNIKGKAQHRTRGMTSNEILTCRDKSINNINLERREHGAEEEQREEERGTR